MQKVLFDQSVTYDSYLLCNRSTGFFYGLVFQGYCISAPANLSLHNKNARYTPIIISACYRVSHKQRPKQFQLRGLHQSPIKTLWLTAVYSSPSPTLIFPSIGKKEPRLLFKKLTTLPPSSFHSHQPLWFLLFIYLLLRACLFTCLLRNSSCWIATQVLPRTFLLSFNVKLAWESRRWRSEFRGTRSTSCFVAFWRICVCVELWRFCEFLVRCAE